MAYSGAVSSAPPTRVSLSTYWSLRTEPDIRVLTTVMLRRGGYVVQCAPNGQEALVLIHAMMPTLIIDVARLHERLLANDTECRALLVKEEAGTLTTADVERLKTARRTQRWLHVELRPSAPNSCGSETRDGTKQDCQTRRFVCRRRAPARGNSS